MLIEFITAGLVVYTMIYIFSRYLLWSSDYVEAAEFDDEKKNNILYSLTAPVAVSDSRKVVYFWFNFYKAKYTN